MYLPPNKRRQGEGGLWTRGRFKNSNAGHPLLMIVTVVLNDEAHIEDTILSVVTQDYENVQYVVIDGRSTDGTVGIIKKYEHAIDYWVSEPDQGIYDAMNKGISLTLKDCLIIFINSGDKIIGNLLSGSIRGPSFLPVRYKNMFGREKKIRIKSQKYGLPNNHQGIIFLNKKIFYDLKYLVAADYDYFLRQPTVEYKSVSDDEGYILYDNMSGYSQQNNWRGIFEIRMIMLDNFGALHANLFYIKMVIKTCIKKCLYLFIY
jgi:glycosyltransferase involved in cell wall biosynthesis